MLGLTTTRYDPNDESIEILQMLSAGYNQKKIADEFGIPHDAMRQRITQLRLNLGASTNEQMMFEFGKLNKPKNKK